MKIWNLPLVVEWSKLTPGASIFIPCIDRRRVERYIYKEAARVKVPVVCKGVIRNGAYGLRIWRIPDNMLPVVPP